MRIVNRSLTVLAVISSFLFAAILPICGQTSSSVSGPALGYSVDEIQRIYPILGFPGASRLGTPLDIDDFMETAVVSPDQTYALAFATGGLVLVQNLDKAAPTIKPVQGTAARGGRIWISPTGSAAAVLWSGGKSIQIFTGLPTKLAPGFSADVTSLTGTVDRCAVSDDGSTILVTVPGKSGSDVFSYTSSNTPQLVASGGVSSSIAFIPNSLNALLADRDANSVRLLSQVGTALSIKTIAAGAPVAQPMAIAAFKDGSSALVANGDSASLVTVDLTTASTTLFTCPCRITALTRLKDPGIFLLTQAGTETIWLFKESAAGPRFVFLPGSHQTSRAIKLPPNGTVQ